LPPERTISRPHLDVQAKKLLHGCENNETLRRYNPIGVKIVQHGRVTRARSMSLSRTTIKIIDGTKRRIKKRRVNAPSKIRLRFKKLGRQARFGTRQE